MIAVDSNLLIYSHRADFDHHQAALQLIGQLCEARVPWALPWACVHEFYRVVTQRGLPFTASTPDQAWAAIHSWVRAPSCQLLSEGSAYLAHLQNLIASCQPTGAMIHDAKIVAVCLSHGVSELWTADRDFSRFPSLSTRNPLRSKPVRD